MTNKKKKFIHLSSCIIIFFALWTFYELMIKPTIQLNVSPLTGTLIQAVIKLSLWTVPSLLFIKKNSAIQIPFPDLFVTKTSWKKWLLLALAFILFLLIGSYSQYGNLQIRASFQLLSLINSVLLVGITEEMVFRGWILNSFLTYMKPWSAILLSSLLFLMIHFPKWLVTGVLSTNILSGDAIQVFVLGIIFGFTFVKSKNIFVPIFLHMIWNLFTILFYA